MGKAFFARGGHRSYTGKPRCIPTYSRDTSGLTHATRILSCDEALAPARVVALGCISCLVFCWMYTPDNFTIPKDAPIVLRSWVYERWCLYDERYRPSRSTGQHAAGNKLSICPTSQPPGCSTRRHQTRFYRAGNLNIFRSRCNGLCAELLSRRASMRWCNA